MIYWEVGTYPGIAARGGKGGGRNAQKQFWGALLTKLDTNTDSSITNLFGLYFDGRMYMKIKYVRNAAGHGHRDRDRGEHFSIICEPGSSYFGNMTPSRYY